MGEPPWSTPKVSTTVPKAIIAPHAGYVYSGPVAGAASHREDNTSGCGWGRSVRGSSRRSFRLRFPDSSHHCLVADRLGLRRVALLLVKWPANTIVSKMSGGPSPPLWSMPSHAVETVLPTSVRATRLFSPHELISCSYSSRVIGCP
ncbi:MAG: AmmeMemoRadiSam system protein B [Acidimicrobiales bacterium]